MNYSARLDPVLGNCLADVKRMGGGMSMQEAKQYARVETDTDIMMGKPVIRGTRITVEHILRMFGAGHSEESVLQAHPQLKPEDIRAAQNYAADSLSDWRVLAAE